MTRWLWFTVLLLLGCTLFNAPFVKAAEDDEEPEVEVSEDAETVETEEPAISHELSSSFLFPDNLDGKFTVGEVATALVVLTNLGDERVNISYIGAQLRSPFDLSYFIQNYTARGVGAFIEPQQQVTVEYKFMPDKSLEALEFWLTGFVTYNTGNGESADQQFVATWFNQTVTLLEKSEPFTAKLSVYIPLLAILAGGFIAREKFGKKKRKGGRKPAADAGAKAPAAAWSVDDLVYKAKPVVSKKDKKAGGKSSKKSS